MRKLLSALLVLAMVMALLPMTAFAATYTGYQSLDATEPITFDGESVTWNGITWTLGENTIFLDNRLDDAQIADNPYAFNDFADAAAALKDGTAAKPMILLTAPGVYWVDDPDDPAVRVPINGQAYPYGATIDCDYLYFYGLNTDPDNVVFACNRGNTQGAEGFFTLFNIIGVGLKSENVTFGNYCNVDLVFPAGSLRKPCKARQRYYAGAAVHL